MNDFKVKEYMKLINIGTTSCWVFNSYQKEYPKLSGILVIELMSWHMLGALPHHKTTQQFWWLTFLRLRSEKHKYRV